MSRLLVSRFAQKKDGKRRGGKEERRSQFRTRKYRRRWRREGKGRTPSVATSTSESAAEGVVASIYQSHLLSRNDTSHLRLSILLSTVIVSVLKYLGEKGHMLPGSRGHFQGMTIKFGS